MAKEVPELRLYVFKSRKKVGSNSFFVDADGRDLGDFILFSDKGADISVSTNIKICFIAHRIKNIDIHSSNGSGSGWKKSLSNPHFQQFDPSHNIDSMLIF